MSCPKRHITSNATQAWMTLLAYRKGRLWPVNYGLLQSGMSVQDVKEKLRRDFLSAYLAELAVWPALQAVNFAKVCLLAHGLVAV